MKSAVFVSVLMSTIWVGSAFAASGAGHGPRDSWNEMQRFEYYIGDLAGALEVCRMYSLHSEMRQLASLTPYGKIGLQSWAAYDDIRGGVCGRAADTAKSILGDKDQLLDYLKAKYHCAGGTCTER